MRSVFAAALSAAILWLWPAGASAETLELDLSRALELARQRAPALAAARARISEARGRLAGASVALRENPFVEGLAGRNLQSGGRPVVEVTAWQPLELGGRRSARVASARAAIERERAGLEVVRLSLLREVGVAYYRAAYASDRLRIIEQAQALAAATVEVAERRRKAGEAAGLDVALAQAALGRTRADQHAAAADRARSIGELRMVLGLSASDEIVLKGTLSADRPKLAVSARRPRQAALRMLAAERDEATADAELGQGGRWPDVALGVRYAQAAGEHALLGGLSLSLPLFERGQGVSQPALARRSRASLELSAAERAAAVELSMARDAYRRRLDAVSDIEQKVLPHLDEGERLARLSYEAGEIGLSNLIALRRELIDTRRAYLEALFEAAVAGVELQAIAGVL